MTPTVDQYINSVLSWIPTGEPRERIEMDLRAHIAERMDRGQSVEEAVGQFGDRGFWRSRISRRCPWSRGRSSPASPRRSSTFQA